jgi:hypothetical protein
MYSREDVRVLVVWSALEGQCIAESIAGGYSALEGAVCIQEDSRRT